ncbi:MAG: sigma-70 family RNA polymerase sigma factor [Planctomycetes bacterium]|nr:sigma-70 family RNA polymerase sigma factor [Planctomycetota bacterium]
MSRPTREQFEALVRDHHAAVHRSAARWLPADEATDVTQDVFVQVLEGKVRLAAARQPRAVLCWLATRLAANRRRGQRRRQVHEENAMSRSSATRSAEGDPAAMAAAVDLQRHVAELVEALPADLRLPLQLHGQDQLTFAEVGLALQVPASTAHDRVQQALQRLRRDLAGRGYTLAATGLPQAIAELPPAVPAGLERQLLALGDGAVLSGTAGVSLAAKLALGALAVTVGVAIGAFAVWGRPGGDTVPVAAGDPAAYGVAAAERPQEPADLGAPAPGAQREPLPGAADRPEAPRAALAAVFHGTVHDAAAWPVAGARVEAVAAGGLKPFALGATTIGADGSFRLQLPPHELQPRAIRLRIQEDGRLLLETGELALPRAESAAPLALVLPAAAGLATSRFELTVAITSAEGAPVATVPVALLPDRSPAPRPGQGEPEARAQSGADGRVVLRGRRPGAKWLFVDGRAAGFAAAFVPVAIDRPGEHLRHITLQPGGGLEVHVQRLDGEPLGWASVWLEHEATGLTHQAKALAGDRFVFAALGDGGHTLHVSGGGELSPAARRGLRAGGPTVEIRLKRRDEERDAGDHQAELHGELIDARTGEVVEWGAFEVDLRPLRDGDSTLPTDWLQPRGPVQTMVQDDRFRRFHLVGLDAGRCGLVVRVPGYATTVVGFDLREGEVRTDLRVALHRGGTLRGRVVDERGQPVAGCRVFPVGLGELGDRIVEGHRAALAGDGERAAEPSEPAARGRTDAGGRFELVDVPVDVELRLLAHRRSGGVGIGPALVLRPGEVRDGLELVLAGR